MSTDLLLVGIILLAFLVLSASFALIARGYLRLQEARDVRSRLPRRLNRQQRRARAQAQRG